MRHAFAAGVALLLGASGAFADPLEGVWQTAKDDNGNFGHIEIMPCGDAFCGTLVRSFNPDGSALASENIGKRIIWDMQARGGGKYAGGKIWSPDRDKTYASRMQLSGDVVTVQGCVLVVCRDGGIWQRVR